MTAGPSVRLAPAYAHRSDHSCACAAWARPSAAGSPPALHVRNPPRHPAPRPNASPLPSPLAPRPMTGTIPQSLLASSAALPPSTSPRPSPQCRSCSTCRPDPHPLSADLDWDQVDPAAALLLPSLLQIAVRVFDSALQPVLP